MDPYATLGVDRTATLAEVRAAYRRRAKAAHPDAGGEPGEFERVKLAADVLSDPERRARYDATGDAGEPVKERTVEDRAAAMIAKTLDEVLFSQLSVERADTIDLISEVRAALVADRAQLDEMTRVGRDVLKSLKRLVKRMKKRPDRDVVGAVIGRRIDAAEREMERLKGAVEVNAAALAAVEGYEFEPGREPGDAVWGESVIEALQRSDMKVKFMRFS